jgi:hypothetical protein
MGRVDRFTNDKEERRALERVGEIPSKKKEINPLIILKAEKVPFPCKKSCPLFKV